MDLQRLDEFPAGAGPPAPAGRRGRFLAREWPFVLAVAAALVLAVAALFVPAPEEAEATAAEAAAGLEWTRLAAELDQRPLTRLALLGAAAGGALLFLAGLPLLGLLLWRHAEGRSLLGPPVAVPRPGWGLWEVVKSAALYFLFLQAAAGLLVALLPGVETQGPATLGAVLVANLLVTLLALRLAAAAGEGGVRRMGFTAGRLPRLIGEGLLGYVAFFPVLVVLALAALILATLLGVKAEENPLVPIVLESDSLGFALFIFLFGALLGPLTEEIFFRGFFYPPLRARLGPAPAIAVNALCFALLHGNLVQLLPIFGLGLVLALLRERSGSLVPSIVLHCLHNLAVLALLYTLKPLLG